MIFATTAGGMFMFAVHLFAPWMSLSQYGVFGTMLQVVNLMMIPALGVQTVFAQQAAAALTEEDRQTLRGTVQALLRWTFFLWALLVLCVLLAERELTQVFSMKTSTALWVTVCIALPQWSLPIMWGLLQGKQDFLWLGWSMVVNGAGRFMAVGVIVVLLHGRAAGALTGALLGIVMALLIAAWHCREHFTGPAQQFPWRSWLKGIVPLTLGLGASHFLLSADMILVGALFHGDERGQYAAAGMIGRGLVIFTMPLSAVMFPKLVRSLAKAESSFVMGQAVIATALLSGLAALGCTLFSLWILPQAVQHLTDAGSILSPSWKEAFQAKAPGLLSITRLIPWFVWCMWPLAIANVLIFSLLARRRYRVMPWLLVVAAAYAAALSYFNGSFLEIIRTLGVFSTLLLLVAMSFLLLSSQKNAA